MVIFWLKRPGNAADRAALVRASEGFRTLPGVVRVQVGSGMPVRRPKIERGFDVCAVFTFASETALARFERHPQHKSAVDSVLKPLVRRYLVFNSIAD